MGRLSKIKTGLTRHFADSTALLTASNPVFSAFETLIAGMPDHVSQTARGIAAGLTYGGMGYLWGKGRDISRKIFHINQQSRERVQTFHDAAYSMGFTSIVSPLLYFSSGTRDFNEIAWGTASAALFGLVQGPLLGYAVDVGRDLTGLGECNRASYPQIVKKQKRMAKKGLAVLLAAASIGAMAGIYALTPNHGKETQSNYQINSK